MTNEIKGIIKLVLSALFTAFAVAGLFFAFTYESKMEEAFKDGYEQAIEEAVLVYSNENGYVLSFEGEEHYYTFD